MTDNIHNPDLLPITDVIPHRPPHLWVSGVQEFTPGISVQGFWTPEDEQFEGHFPGQPVLQGVQQLEALAQLGCYAAMYEQPGELGVLFAHADVYFSNPVFPGDTLELRVDLTEQSKKSVFEGVGIAAVNGHTTCEAKIEGKVSKKMAIGKMLETAKQQRIQSRASINSAYS